MPATRDRIIIDTNLWISFLLTHNFSKLDDIFLNEGVVLLFSQELLDEFIEVSQRPKFRRYFSSNDLENLLQQISLRAEFINVRTDITLCRDPKDNFLLSLAKDGEATHLVTGDKDLLVLQKFDKTLITTMTDYLTGK